MLFFMSRPGRSRCFPSLPLRDICIGVSSAVRVVGRRGEEGEESDTDGRIADFWRGQLHKCRPLKRQSGRPRVHEVTVAQARHGTAEKYDVANARQVRACSTTSSIISFLSFFNSSVLLSHICVPTLFACRGFCQDHQCWRGMRWVRTLAYYLGKYRRELHTLTMTQV